jgi:ankyrin repeat protein
MRRRVWFALCAALAFLLVAAASVLLWLWWPTANTLTGYAARGDLSGVRLSLRLGVDPNEASRSGWRLENAGPTPLTAAAQFGQVEAIRLLIDQGADPNLLDGRSESPGQTPLATAATHGQLDACRALLDAGADPNIPTSPNGTGEPTNWTALDWALQGGHAAVADLLRQHGAVEGGRRRGGQ